MKKYNTEEELRWYYQFEDDILPPWASSYARGQFVLGAQLCTVDGRKIGNGVIIEIVFNEHIKCDLFSIRTDIGNTTKMTFSELYEYFYPPKYIMKEY